MRNAPTWWFLSLLSGSLSGLPSVSVLSWFQPLCLLQFVHHADVVTGPIARRIGVALLAHSTGALGYWVSHASMLNCPTWNVEGVLLVLAICVVMWAILVLAFLSDAYFRNTYPLAANIQPLVFPLLWTAFWHLLSKYFLFGAIGNPANTQTGVRPLILSASLFGMEGITFIMSWSAAMAHQHLVEDRQHNDLATSDMAHVEAARSRHRRAWVVAVFAMLLYGGVWNSVLTGAFFQENLPDIIKPTAPVSCVFGDLADGERLTRLLNLTAARLKAGDEIVLWSETSAYVQGDRQEEELLARVQSLVSAQSITSRLQNRESGDALGGGAPHPVAGRKKQNKREERGKLDGGGTERRLLNPPWEGDEREPVANGGVQWKLPWNGLMRRAKRRLSHIGGEAEGALGGRAAIGGGPYVGVSYQKLLNGHKEGKPGSASNKLVLVGPKGVEFAYEKVHPVFFLERDVVPGKRKAPPSVTTASGFTIGGAICFDYEFPAFIRGASRKSVDLMLQPSMTWGAIGGYDANSDAIRAVENGFTLLRCSSVGISAVVSPTLRYYAYQETLAEGFLSFRLPIARRVRTPYDIFGFLLGPLILFLALVAALLSWVPSDAVRKLLSHAPVSVALALTGEDPRIEQTFDGVTGGVESIDAGWWCWGNNAVEPPRQGLVDSLVDNFTLGVIEANTMREPILTQRGSRSY